MPAPTAAALIDRVDESDRPIGVVNRGRVFAEGANFRTVHALLLDERGRLLLQQLARGRNRHALLWGSSVAGYLHAGESYEAAAHRRVREELGVEPALTQYGRTAVTDHGVIKFVGLFEGCVAAHEPTVQDRNHIEQLRWLSPDVLAQELHDHPERFTDTFRDVFAYWRAQQS